MKREYRRRSACPCCNTAYPDKCKVVNGSLSEETDADAVLNGWVGLNRDSFFSYSECAACQTLATTIYPTEEMLFQLYSRMPPNMEEAVNKEDQRKNQHQYAAHIIRFLGNLGAKGNPKSILELGADCGLLASGISELVNTSDWHYTAIEPNELVRADLANTLAYKYGSNGIHTDIREMSKEDSGRLFDIIAAIHVFDHIFSIGELIHSLKEKLSEKGFIYFVVHNPESTLAKTLGTRWPPFCAQHPQLFTMKGVRALADKAGLRVVNTGRTFNHFQLRMITRFTGIPCTDLDNLSLRAPLGNRYYILMNKEHI